MSRFGSAIQVLHSNIRKYFKLSLITVVVVFIITCYILLYYILFMVLPWTILDVILDKNLMSSRYQFICFQKIKLLGVPTHKDFIFLFILLCSPKQLAVSKSLWKFFYFVLFCIYKGNRKTLFLKPCRN